MKPGFTLFWPYCSGRAKFGCGGVLAVDIGDFHRQCSTWFHETKVIFMPNPPISNKFHKFWWFEMFWRIMLRICKKQHYMEHLQGWWNIDIRWHHYKHCQMPNLTFPCWRAHRDDRIGHLVHPIRSPHVKLMQITSSGLVLCRGCRPAGLT